MSSAPRLARTGLLIAFIVLVADQFSKWLLLSEIGIASRPPITVTPFFDLVMVWNRGISFGMLGQGSGELQALLLMLLSLSITACMLCWLSRAPRFLSALALGLVIGGALGNVLDRAFRGAVADFFSFHYGPYHWPAFNVADAAICVGVALLCLESMLSPPKP